MGKKKGHCGSQKRVSVAAGRRPAVQEWDDSGETSSGKI